jgi:N-acetylglucosaminyl-diphospho-decaprenol L-rhamnosyltransferase
MAERRVVVATVAAGRHLHLARQAHAVARMTPAPAEHLVVSLDAESHEVPGARVLHTPAPAGEPLPVGAGRNTAIAEAGEDALVVWLDVDCIPAPDLISHVEAAVDARPRHLVSWPVGRLAPLPDDRLEPTTAELDAARDAAREQGRPVPAPGEVVDEARAVLFWSLAFAVTPRTHARIGGFDPGFTGYGAEDTDYALRAQEAGVGLVWAGGAWAHHQHHPVSSPPVEHLDDIVRNARRFHARWGRWPMEGWLEAFARDGLVHWTPGGDVLERVAAPHPG